MTEEKFNYFHTFGFVVYKQMLTPDETESISDAFDASMLNARGGEDFGLTQDESGNSKRRQQINFHISPKIAFFDYAPDVFYPLLDDERFVDVFRALLGDDYIMAVSEGIIHAGGTGWHHDNVAEGDFFTMRAHLYLDKLGPEDGCLSVIPGSHFAPYREALTQDNGMGVRASGRMGVKPGQMPGRYDLINEPGDVVFLNHKTHHSALSGRAERRCVHMNAGKSAHTHDRDEQLAALDRHLLSPYEEVRLTAAAAKARITPAEEAAA